MTRRPGQNQEVVEDVARDSPGRITGSEVRKCIQKKGGVCQEHRKGVTRIFKPCWEATIDKDRKKTTTYKKNWIWRCNVVSMKNEKGVR